MKCAKCGHTLSQDEVNANMCWECGAIINLELVSDDKVEAEELIANMEQAQKEQDKRQRIEEKQKQEAGAEYGVISAIHTFFSIISILAVIGGIFAGITCESIWVALLVILSVSITYCVVRLLIAIAYLLCDIKDNTSSNPKKKVKKAK